MTPAPTSEIGVGPPTRAVPGAWFGARVLRILSLAMFLGLVLVATIAGLVRPDYNWDMLPYIAVSLEDRIPAPDALHGAVYDMVEKTAPSARWHDIVGGSAYNSDMYANAAHFHSQLSMYRVKIGYREILRLLDRVTDPVTATAIVSAGSALALGLLLAHWMVRRDFAEAAPLVLAAIMLAGYFDMALIATPDLLMAALGIGGIYLFVTGRPWMAVPLFMAMYLVRPDGIVFLFALVLAAFAFRTARLPALLAFLLSLAVYRPLAEAAGHPGWWPHFYFSNVALQMDMDGFAPAFSILDYCRGVLRGASMALRLENWPMLMLVLVCGWGMLVKAGRGPDRRGAMMLTAILLCLGGKFALFPLPDDRVYFMFVAAFAMIVVEAWKPRLFPAAIVPDASPMMSQKGCN